MTAFFFILLEIIVPVFIVIGIGFWLQKKFHMDMKTLTRLNIYFVVPAIIFTKLYEATVAFSLLALILGFLICLTILLYIVGWLIAKITGVPEKAKIVYSNSLLFYNSGNYGLPVNGLVFKQDPYAMSIQIIVLVFQNTITFSYGILALKSGQESKSKALLGYLRMPLFHALIFAVILNVFNIPLPHFLSEPIRYIADAMIAVALMTLGAQVAQLPFKLGDLHIFTHVFTRLIIGPALGLLLIFLFGLDGIVAQALFISSAMPTAVNSSIIAEEYDNSPDIASRIVLLTTILSSITVTFVIFLSQIIL